MARPASDIATRIVHAARERFLLEGVDGASLRKIASDAGTSIGMVYYYFKTKDDLFLAVVEEVYAGIMVDITKELAADASPDARVRKLFERVARMSELEFKVVRLILREALGSSVRLQRLAKRFATGHAPLIAAVIAEGIGQQRFRDDVHPLAILAATVALGIMPQVLHRLVSEAQLPIARVLPSREDAASTLCDVLMHGIATPSTPARRKR
ncbi:MAG TPA: TetR/AcrR family transcriptional regulator [Polyangiales bacterium]